MGEVLDIVPRGTVDRAWEAYRAHAARSFDDKRLLLDRGYVEEWARLSIMPRVY